MRPTIKLNMYRVRTRAVDLKHGSKSAWVIAVSPGDAIVLAEDQWAREAEADAPLGGWLAASVEEITENVIVPIRY